MDTRGQVLCSGVVVKAVDLTPASNLVATDASYAKNFRITADQSFTLSNPTGLAQADDMCVLTWRIKQDGVGGRLLTAFGSKFDTGADIGTVTLSTAAGAIDYISARYRYVDGGSGDKFDVLAFVSGY